jgi:hypothetical protein
MLGQPIEIKKPCRQATGSTGKAEPKQPRPGLEPKTEG